MSMVAMRNYQVEAVETIIEAVNDGRRHMVVEMPTGCGKTIVLAKTIENFIKYQIGKILIVVDNVEIKHQISHSLFDNYKESVLINKYSVDVETKRKLLHHSIDDSRDYQLIIFFNVAMSQSLYDTLNCKEKTTIVFSDYKNTHRLFESEEIVYSYSIEQAVRDGILTPAMDSKTFDIAVRTYSEQLLESFGYTETEPGIDKQNDFWKKFSNSELPTLWVEYKTYKSQVVSPTAAQSLLNTVVMQKTKHHIPSTDYVLLLVFSRIPTFQKDEIFNRYNIIVLDIENLVFYCKNNSSLLKQLSRITYFPIDYIEGISSAEVQKVGIVHSIAEKELSNEETTEDSEVSELIQLLKNCKVGKKHSSEYEDICERIIRYLFEANYFNRLSRQHKTNDEHFRMDLIGSLKISQRNDESMHPLWQMFVQHYNSHFVVFEFKNYSKPIDQNLIYITEKYLFNPALRNVAIIISRKGFSDSAKFAAKGCLKENGKLILNIADEDLINMLQLKNDSAADYLLGKLEDFLMEISK